MKVQVEFYGIPRLRAGRAALELLCAPAGDSTTVAEVLTVLAGELPDFARHCLNGTHLREGYIANLNGRQFVTDPATKISDGDSLLILSADAGG